MTVDKQSLIGIKTLQQRNTTSLHILHRTSLQIHKSSQQVHKSSQQVHRSSQQGHRPSQQGHRPSQQGHRSSQQGHRTSQQGKAAYVYEHAHQIAHKRYIDMLKHDFLKNYHHPTVYKKTPKDFDKIKTIGSGAFGIVFLARDTSSFVYYAMKAIDKAEIMKKNCLKQLIAEKRVLQSINFPFLISMDFICKDNSYVYFLLPFESGGELYTLIKRTGPLAENLIQFYAAQMVLALEYLHNCCIVHRDVKPENILITITGYIKLVDFGFCKVIKTRTWTICGTPEYLAPEVILTKGYTYSVDWWAFGVLIYEMCAGYPPFYSANPIKLYEKVLTGNFKTPEAMNSIFKSLVKHLLEVDPTKRYGSLKAGVFDIKTHPWFHEINWYTILNQKDVPPYKPSCRDTGDTTNFREIPEKKLVLSPECLYEKEFESF